MADPDKQSILGEVSQHLGAIFRHMLPGALVVGAARLAHPEWFCSLDLRLWQHLVALALLTVVIGNTWFAVNRYGLHQFVDYLLYRMGSNGPAKAHEAQSNYVDDLGKYTYKSLHTPETSARARQHVAFRASTVLLVLTLGEVAILFSFWHAANTVFERHRCWMFVGAALAIVVGIWQMVITRRIDYYVVQDGAA
jgi:hypothetical protein